MSLVRLDRLRVAAPLAARACGHCTACCTVMAVNELRKPSRRACEHVTADGCGVHAERPASCRAFNCAWLRGVIEGDDATRPDALGVMFDYFETRDPPATHLIAFELWQGALDAPEARAIVEALAASHEVALSRRDGTWSLLARDDE